MKIRTAGCLLLVALSTFAGCDAQVNSEYRGEPLATIRGEITTRTLNTEPQYSAMVWWRDFAEDDIRTLYSQDVVVVGNFPAQFELDVFTPPPEGGLNSAPDDAARFGLGLIVAIPDGFFDRDYETASDVPANGVSPTHVLAYVESDLTPNSQAAKFFGAPLTAGFHLIEVTGYDGSACNEFAGHDCLHPAPAGFSTMIEVVIAEQTDMPSLKPDLEFPYPEEG